MALRQKDLFTPSTTAPSTPITTDADPSTTAPSTTAPSTTAPSTLADSRIDVPNRTPHFMALMGFAPQG